MTRKITIVLGVIGAILLAGFTTPPIGLLIGAMAGSLAVLLWPYET